MSPATTSPCLSVVVPVRNGAMQLARCLEALRMSDYTDFEVIVVDDCSSDNTKEIVERYQARYLRTPSKVGPGGARNLGAQSGQGEIVVFVDADVLVPPEALKLIADEFEHDLRLAALFGSYDEEPAWGNFLSQYKNLMHHYIHQTSNESAATFWAGCGAVRRSVFRQFGGFDAQRYPEPSIEDIELGLRMVRAGQKIRLNKHLQARHLKKWTLRGLLRADIRRRAVPWTRLILDSGNLPRDLNLTYGARFSAVLVCLLVSLLALLPFSVAGGFQRISPADLILSMIVDVALLLALNWPVYRFFARRRGWRFTVLAMLAHWFYYLYSVIVFLVLSAIFYVRLPLNPRRADARRT